MAAIPQPTSDLMRPGPSRSSRAMTGRITVESLEAVRKRGDAFRLRREVEAMEYVQLHTSIPIPAILSVHIEAEAEGEAGSSEGDGNWILMSRLPGSQLDTAWPSMSDQARSETTRQLTLYLKQLRELRPSGSSNSSGDGTGWIGSCSHGPAYDHRLDNMTMCGPFASVGEFHDYLVAPILRSPRPEWTAKYRKYLPDTHDVHFAHADLSGENILVHPETGDVSGILDWEMAGFWPAWWEYRKALFASRNRPWWSDLVKEIVPAYPDETEADMDIEMF